MFRQLTRAYRGEKKLLGFIALLNIVSAGAEAAALISVAPLIQAAAEGQTRYAGSIGPWNIDSSLASIAVFAGAMLIVTFLVQLFTSYMTARLTSGYRLRTRLSVVRSFQSADWSVQAREREGWLRTLSTDNVEFAALALQNLAGWIKGIVGLSVFLVGAIAVNGIVALVITSVLGLVMAAIRPINQYAKRLGAEHARYNVEISEELATLTMTGRELKAYGVVPQATVGYRNLAREQRSVLLRVSVAANLGSPIFRTSAMMLIVAMIAIVALRGDSEIASVGLVAVLLYRASNYGTVVVRFHQQLVGATPIITQLQDGLDRLREFALAPGTLDPPPIRRLAARSVSYTYPGETSPALQELSFEVEIGEAVGIVGPSGAGKSTLAELLVGLRRPGTGNVLVDDVELAAVSDEARSHCVALVSQNVPLVPGSVADNVRFYRDIDDETVKRAISAAGLEEVIAKFPEGDQTSIGPGARALSGGQAQRIGIARALAGKPSILVLDEPTSALDAEAELWITETIRSLSTSFGIAVIAHRLTTLRHCDRIVVLEDGRISDQGSMDDVSRRNAFLEHAIAAGRLGPLAPSDGSDSGV